MGNQMKTALLLGVLTCLIVWIGNAAGGQNGMIIALVFALCMNLFSYWFSDKIVLSLYRAQQVSESEAPDLYAIVRKLCSASGLPLPRIYLIPSDSPNAFATGRNPRHAAVAVTSGILRLLTQDELEGVLAHELAHIHNRDILIGTIAAVLAGAITMLANMLRWAAMFGAGARDEDDQRSGIGMLIVSIIAPIAALIIQLAISRSREYLADETGARFAGNPLSLASALEKLSLASERIPLPAHPSTAHMFIVHPLSGKALLNLFSTHPPVEDRIRRLRAMTAW
ncbi:MAG: zinc metalloprotease HtpX [Desulfobacterota bacterium]|nr:zinc metalloprotease HtpX [Thermodesulfobacteriota bacterium]